MTLTAADVAEIMRLVEQSSFDELTLEIDGMKLTLRRGGAASLINGAATDGQTSAAGGASASRADSARPGVSAKAATAAPVGALSSAATAAPAAGSSPNSAADRSRADPNVQDVPAPLLGTFYRSPKPGAPPFVEIGSTVEEDTVVAIIEVMKLMNTVRAGVRGTVSEILARDGALVEYGEPILRVRKVS